MKIQDKLYGFVVEKSEDIAELSATLHTMRHEKTGARLCYLENSDENMTFAIAFPTPPKDDTGIFHIIEHSVLCGSRKFPLKEPFVNLLKSSLNTFLNAMTYEDRTVYPLASRCERDFLNLTDVYLDAVFHPKMLENDNVFLGEGWHYEYNEEEKRLAYSGVVYSEMCGAYSSPDDVGAMELNRLLYDGTLYAYDSGGDPRAIPNLTYADFVAAHKKYYHPSNSYIYLDGRVNLDKALPLIDSYLSKFDRAEVERVENVYRVPEKKESRIGYEIPEGEEAAGRVRLLFGYSHSEAKDTKAAIAVHILADVLAASNESHLKKRILDLGLAEDVSIYTNRAERQTLTIEVKGVREENVDAVKLEVDRAIRELCEAGIEKEKLIAAANIIEFKQRERDFGAFPAGVANALSVFGVWTYGNDARAALAYEDTLAEIRAATESDYFERLLLSITVDNPYSATVIMLPDRNAISDFESEMQTRLDKTLENLTKEELLEIIKTEKRLKEYQMGEDSEEAKSTLPTLPLSEINKKEEKIPTEDKVLLDARVIAHSMSVGGISYAALHFDASDLSSDELPYLSLLAALLTNLPTGVRDPLSLKNAIKTNLGSFVAGCAVLPDFSKKTPYKTVLSISASALDTKLSYLSSIASEVILDSIYEDETILKIILTQNLRELEEALVVDGESFALCRLAAESDPQGAAKEYLSGYEAYRALKSILASVERGEKILPVISRLAKKLFVRERLTLSVSGEQTEALARDLLSALPSGAAAIPSKISPLEKRNEGFAVPSRVAYAALGASADLTPKMLGILRVVRSILSYEHLWNAVRIVGGAYGTGFVTRKDGSLAFYSYRDPSPTGAIAAYRASADFLKRFANECPDLTQFIIGAYGEYDILRTKRLAAAIKTNGIMCGWTDSMEEEMRDGLISCTRDDLIAAANLISRITSRAPVCVFASRDMLSKIEDVRDNIREI